MSNLKIKIYTVVRVLTGISLIFHSFLNTVNYNMFLDHLDTLFANASFFDNAFAYNTAPLVPFAEFGLGLFLTLGLYTRVVLKIGIFLLLSFALFLLDVSQYNAILFHSVMLVLFYALFQCLECNKKSMDFQIKAHSLL